MDDYEVDDTPCPKCGNPNTHYRRCGNFGCEEGFIDEHDDDPINFAPGEEFMECDECSGHGVERWCPKCGADFWRSQLAGGYPPKEKGE